MQVKLRRIGNNILTIIDGKAETIVIPSDYNDEKLFSLAYKIQEHKSKIAESLLLKELSKYRKVKEKSPEVVANRIAKKKIDREIKAIKSFDYNNLPIHLPEDWKSILDSKEDNTHIKNFLLLLSLNKNEFTRNNFLKQFSGKYPYITDLGFLVGVRQVHKVTQGDDLHDFVQAQYTKIKGIWKKKPSDYVVVNGTTNKYNLSNAKLWGSTPAEINSTVGNLQDLYFNYKPKDKTVYCSNYNYKKPEQESWNLGEVISIEGDINFGQYENDEICGYSRYHIKTDPFSCVGNRQYGDVNVVTIVNPAKVLGIRESWKYVTSEMYLACEITDEEIKETFKEDFGSFSFDYANIAFDEIKQISYKKNYNQFKASQKQKINSLKESIPTSKKEISAQDFNEILKNRVQLI